MALKQVNVLKICLFFWKFFLLLENSRANSLLRSSINKPDFRNPLYFVDHYLLSAEKKLWISESQGFEH